MSAALDDGMDFASLAVAGPSELKCATTTKPRGRPRGSLGETAMAIRDAITNLSERFERMTVRQCFYQVETAGVVEKTEGGYRQVQAQVLKMRREGLLEWSFITDGTRWQRKPASYTDAGDYVETVARGYRRDLWQGQDVRIEVWLEKDALADVVYSATRRWDVSLMVSRGQSSATFLHAAAMEAQDAYEEAGVETYIYALYDHDAGGLRAFSAIERELPTHAPDTPIHFERLAVNEDQIREMGSANPTAKEEGP